ncbi:MAG: universal stress protein [Nocardioidaceae bacterium]
MTPSTSSTLVVGIDGTGDGERALRYGLALARREDLSLRLVHVAPQPQVHAPVRPYLPEPQRVQIGQTVLAQARSSAEAAGFDPERTATVLAHGPRTAALLQQARDARCVVLGTRSSGLQHLFTGSTSLSVAAHADLPVHCVPRLWDDEDEARGVVVAGLDGSDADEDVVAAAFDQAEVRSGTTLRFVHAWRPVGLYETAILGRTLRARWEDSAREPLTKRIEEAARHHPGVAWGLDLRYERMPVALHMAADEADVLVLGRHGHLVPTGLLVGSNTRTLLRAATCPVVVVPVRTGHQR